MLYVLSGLLLSLFTSSPYNEGPNNKDVGQQALAYLNWSSKQ